MSGPNLDLEKPNAIGGLDRLVTNIALAFIAGIPTFLTCIAMPWKLRPLLDRDDPDGRMGMLLAPGAYFPLSLMIFFIIAAVLATPETLSNNGAFIGPGLAVAVQTAASEGNIWKIVATIMPIYGMAIFVGIIGTILKRWAGQDWTLRISLRAAFYVMGTLTTWLILTTAIIDLIIVPTKNYDLQSSLYRIIMLPTLGALIWIYSGFFYNNGTLSKIRSAVLGAAMVGLFIVPIILMDLIMRM